MHWSRLGGRVSRGTEISKYPEEKKSHEIPLVSDERTGISLNPPSGGGCRTVNMGLSERSRTPWNRWLKNVIAVYAKRKHTLDRFLSRLGDGKLPSESGVTTLQG